MAYEIVYVNSLSVNNRVQNEEDCNSQPDYPEDIDQRLERTEDVLLELRNVLYQIQTNDFTFSINK